VLGVITGGRAGEHDPLRAELSQGSSGRRSSGKWGLNASRSYAPLSPMEVHA
jgi:hypothetical protein